MLQSRNLDDQSYDQILQAAVSRLPVLCTEWTDHNEADPGITLLELFSWYQEMQRYQLNRVTKPMRRAMLNFLGIVPKEARAAECFVQIPPMENTVLPEGTRLATKENVAFELQETVRNNSLEVVRLLVCRNNEEPLDITEIIKNDAATVHPFDYGNQRSSMEVYFDGNIGSELRVWFDVVVGGDCIRTPFENEEQVPRVIRWKWNGEVIEPLYDQTHALSMSGFIGFPTDATRNGGVLRAELVDPGCEEMVRLRGIFCNRYRALQVETKSKIFSKTVPQSADCTVDVTHALAFNGTLSLFLRSQEGWVSVKATNEELTNFGERITLDSSNAVGDGDPNLWVVLTVMDDDDDKIFYHSTGLPNQVVELRLHGKEPVGDFSLICSTLGEDGKVYPQIWHRVKDMSACGPRDRVFLYDSAREEITFGNGERGDIVPAGLFAIMFGDLTISDCYGGNIPGGSILYPKDSESGYLCTEGIGGAAPESVEDAEARYLKKISTTKKCATVQDYCDIAKKTPGLRVAKVKALPGFDPKEMNSKIAKPIVSVVVMPYSQDVRPMPDQRFLNAISCELEKCRPICTKVKVLPPRYVEIGLQVRLQAEDTLDEKTVRNAMEEWFSIHNPKRDIGSAVLQNEISLRLQQIPGVLLVNQVHLYSRVVGCRVTTEGNLVVPPDAIAWLKEFQLEVHN